MDIRTGMGIMDFADKFDGNWDYLDRNSINGIETMAKEFDDAYVENSSFKAMADAFVTLEKYDEALMTAIGKAAFMMATNDIINETRIKKYGNDGMRYVVKNLDTQVEMLFQARSAYEAMSKFKYTMGWRDGSVNDLHINKTESGHCLYMNINGETWCCINRKPDGKW